MKPQHEFNPLDILDVVVITVFVAGLITLAWMLTLLALGY